MTCYEEYDKSEDRRPRRDVRTYVRVARRASHEIEGGVFFGEACLS